MSSANNFSSRHLGVGENEIKKMLTALRYSSLDDLMRATLPTILLDRATPLRDATSRSEAQLHAALHTIAERNICAKSYIGLGYSPVATPAVIARNILEDPRWYTAYTPYQAELSQGRLEALLIFQQLVMDLTALDIANASLLDESSAAAEAMNMAFNHHRRRRHKFFADNQLFPQTLAVLHTRAEPRGIELVVAERTQASLDKSFCGGILQYPCADGTIPDLASFNNRLHKVGALAITSADLFALTLLPPPAAYDADIVVGTTQRFGLPLFFGGPHAAYLATRRALLRSVPGRLIGVTKDMHGGSALRMALQTREQHIRREKATSNICTAQVLPAVIAALYAVYQGAERLRAEAKGINMLTLLLRKALQERAERGGKKSAELANGKVSGERSVLANLTITNESCFDTLTIALPAVQRREVLQRAQQQRINLRTDVEDKIGITLNALTTVADVQELAALFVPQAKLDWQDLQQRAQRESAAQQWRAQDFMTHAVFNEYQTETEFVRFVNRLVSKDISLVQSMIPLGSCTMKLNSVAELQPVSWSQFSAIHPYAPPAQTQGYQQLIAELQQRLAELSGLPAVSLQPNAGSQGELAGLLAIRNYHAARGQGQRAVCLIPASAHGTNPASATMAGLRTIAVACGSDGSIDAVDLRAKTEQYHEQLAALMITYPSTHGVFDENIVEVCDIVHQHGGQVYLDGANMNALVGLARPGDFGADVLHLNLHKTFCIPHGGGGPGVGPVAAAEHLAPYLPSNPLGDGSKDSYALASAPHGSAGIFVISWAYLQLMGSEGLKRATQIAILNANYLAMRLTPHYDILFRGRNGLVAHECIVDCRVFKSVGLDVSDVARRLMDYGFHSPTMSWPVAQTLMIEPTESESLAEIERFCAAMIAIRGEIGAIERGELPRDDNPLVRAPHTLVDGLADNWERPYSKQVAFYPLPYLRERKFWPAVNKVDQAYGDRNFRGGLIEG